jgi:catechol 2,3-dioxygenase
MDEADYKIPPETRIGHIHLKVSDLNRSLEFYRDLLGFSLVTKYGSEAAFLSAGGYHHHIGLNTWESKNALPAPVYSTGLYHVAICYPRRKDLAFIYDRLKRADYPLSGAADHGVSEALYLEDPDSNGIELYWDKPEEKWPRNDEGQLYMYTKRLDLNDLLTEIKV